jgi:hypothetical protein
MLLQLGFRLFTGEASFPRLIGALGSLSQYASSVIGRYVTCRGREAPALMEWLTVASAVAGLSLNDAGARTRSPEVKMKIWLLCARSGRSDGGQ